MTLAEAEIPFLGSRIPIDAQARWTAVACDVAVVFAVALVLFIIANRFWIPLSITALSYYVGSTLLLGNSPGVSLFVARSSGESLRPVEPVRAQAQRPRHVDPARGRTPEVTRSPFRAPRRARTTRT